MSKYRIINSSTGTDMGLYIADSEEEALDMLAIDSGYEDYLEACLYNEFKDSDIDVVKV